MKVESRIQLPLRMRHAMGYSVCLIRQMALDACSGLLTRGQILFNEFLAEENNNFNTIFHGCLFFNPCPIWCTWGMTANFHPVSISCWGGSTFLFSLQALHRLIQQHILESRPSLYDYLLRKAGISEVVARLSKCGSWTCRSYASFQ